MNCSRALAVFFAALGMFQFQPDAARAQTQARLRVETTRADHLGLALVAKDPMVRPGHPLTVGVYFALDPGWHIYWRNPGDSGEAPRLRWHLPDGFSAGEILWPIPHRITAGPVANYGYAGSVLLAVRLTTPAALPPSAVARERVDLSVDVSWLVCSEDCIPGKARLTLSVPIKAGADAAPTKRVDARFRQVQAEQPKRVAARVVQDAEHLLIDLPWNGPRAIDAEFFPYAGLSIIHSGEQEVEPRGDGITLRVPQDPTRDRPLERLAGLVVVQNDTGRKSFDFEAPVVHDAPGAGSPSAAQPTRLTPGQAPAPAHGLAWMLVLGLVGGLLLNLMPCVFPVLSLKVLGVAKSGHDTAAARRDAWAYTAGVVLSFWLVAGGLLALRAGAAWLGWGFQLQSAGFVAALTGLMVLVALNLAGVYEVGLSLGRVGSLRILSQDSEPMSVHAQSMLSSFATGALAVVIATPCTAPFMGTAVGFALTQPAHVSILVFTALALGMASPYLGLGYAPALLARLPRPGPWLPVLRGALAFPMLGTALWLLHVFASLTSTRATFHLMVALLLGALGAWIYGRYQQSSRQPAWARVCAWSVLAGAVAFGALGARVQAAGPKRAAQGHASGSWEPWSAERVASLRAEGRPVFVNFTADWCLSCKANELVVFDAQEVQSVFAEHHVAALRADWTQRDTRIARELASHGRAGVPLYLYYAPHNRGAPIRLPSILTRGMLLRAIRTTTTEEPR